MKNILFACIAIFAVALFACEKEELIGNKTMVFTYHQTQCADPWTTGATDNATVQNLKDYLAAQGLEGPLLSVSLTSSPDAPPSNCTGCTCKTGKVFLVSVMQSESLKQLYLDKGFMVKL